MTSEGMRAGPPEILERISRGEAVDPSLYHFRTVMRFRTGAERYKRLNTIIAVAVAERQAALVELSAYEVL